MIDYPHQVGVGKSVSIDVFVPVSVDLFHFKEVAWKSYHFNKEFSVFTNFEDSLSLPNKKELVIPSKKDSTNLEDAQASEDGYKVPDKFKKQEEQKAITENAQKNKKPDLDNLIIIN